MMKDEDARRRMKDEGWMKDEGGRMKTAGGTPE
jgi:hypothetical protein